MKKPQMDYMSHRGRRSFDVRNTQNCHSLTCRFEKQLVQQTPQWCMIAVLTLARYPMAEGFPLNLLQQQWADAARNLHRLSFPLFLKLCTFDDVEPHALH